MQTLFHITARADWEAAQAQGHYTHPSLASEGFIHFSTKAQLLPSAGRFYAEGTDELVVLVIDPSRLAAELRWEPAHVGTPDQQDFPHLYGPLNLDAVVDVLPLTRDEQGRFVLGGGVDEPQRRKGTESDPSG
ncbi:MAG: DUF952 domain-containing protein [Planctomycetota bacterium]